MTDDRKEKLEIVLREADGPQTIRIESPPKKGDESLLQRLVRTVDNLIPEAGRSAGRWMFGWGEQSVAKAAEVKAKAMVQLGNLDLESERLIFEREKAVREAAEKSVQAEREHEQRMFELQTQRIAEAADRIIRLKELGVDAGPARTLGCSGNLKRVAPGAVRL